MDCIQYEPRLTPMLSESRNFLKSSLPSTPGRARSKSARPASISSQNNRDKAATTNINTDSALEPVA
ncbi:Uncharacterized protein HZ326_11947 [Fusarium oxysporum f. sp. albedinis]|nr:Uncharacterized protein HZ326_11947 [Fusarium oxysporum f. sp. albedinis]